MTLSAGWTVAVLETCNLRFVVLETHDIAAQQIVLARV